MTDSHTTALALRLKRAHSPDPNDPSGGNSTPQMAADQNAAVAGASQLMNDIALPIREREILQPKGSKAHARKLEKLREIEENWRDCWTGKPHRGFLPCEIRPRELVNGQKALFGDENARVLENEEYPAKLVDALHALSLLTKDNMISAMQRLTSAVQKRQVFGSVGHGTVPNQLVCEVLPKDVWDLIAEMKKGGYGRN